MEQGAETSMKSSSTSKTIIESSKLSSSVLQQSSLSSEKSIKQMSVGVSAEDFGTIPKSIEDIDIFPTNASSILSNKMMLMNLDDIGNDGDILPIGASREIDLAKQLSMSSETSSSSLSTASSVMKKSSSTVVQSSKASVSCASISSSKNELVNSSSSLSSLTSSKSIERVLKSSTDIVEDDQF